MLRSEQREFGPSKHGQRNDKLSTPRRGLDIMASIVTRTFPIDAHPDEVWAAVARFRRVAYTAGAETL